MDLEAKIGELFPPMSLSTFAHSVPELTRPTYRYVLLDFETTGLNAADEEIIEVGALKMEGLKVVGTFERLTKPSKQIPSAIVELTGITNEMVAEKPSFKEIALEGFVRRS